MITDKNDPILLAGGGGSIGGWLVGALLAQGFTQIRSVDVKPLSQWYQRFPAARNLVLDLREKQACLEACRGAVTVYNLAGDMGGMGFIETHEAECMISVLINTHLLMAARKAGVRRFFYSSSACV